MNDVMALLPGLAGARSVGLPAVAGMVVQRVHTDTRTLRPGDVFVALSGERFDAHDHLAAARAAGAVAAVAERGLAQAGLPGVEVPDSRAALGELGRLWRERFTLPLIAVTGSNGKTTVTQMVAAILRAAVGDAATLATQGNFNNDIGVPLTLLRLRPEHQMAVLELGMNHPGEIATLAALAQPTVALVNNAQREHQEFMATVEAVAHENAATWAALPAYGVAVFPSDDTYTPLWRTLAQGHRILTFGADAAADVTGTAVWQGDAWQLHVQTPLGAVQAVLRVAGRHNVRNAWAATAAALAAGVPLSAVAQGLSAFEPVTGRSRALPLVWPSGQRTTLVDDSYNANPDSVRAAIDVLADLSGPRLLLLGDMGEVGEQGLAFHREVLQHARDCGIEHVWTIGPWLAQVHAAEPDLARYWPDWNDLNAATLALAPALGSVLVKGSRFMRMERLVQALQALAAPPVQQEEGVQHAA